MRKNTFSGFTVTVYLKPVFAAILLIATLCGCGGVGNNTPDDKEIKVTPGPMPTPPIDFNDTDLGRQIRRDYLDGLHSSGIQSLLDLTIDDVSITSYYGNYNGSVPVMITAWGFGYPAVMTYIVVADVEFVFGGNIITVWKEGQFYSLEEAYNLGFLTQEDLRSIADLRLPVIIE